MRVLVTGGAGFIGGHLCRALTDFGAEVIALDDLTTGREQNLHGSAARLRIGSIMDEALLSELMPGLDSVVHLAGRPSVALSIADPGRSHEVNATGTLRVLTAARDAQVPHVVVASSSSVYGDTEVLPKHEDLPLRPRSPYAASKAAAELYSLAFAASYGLRVLAVRLFNVFGPGQRSDHPYAAVIPRFCAAALTGKPLELYGDGTQTRDFTSVRTVVDVFTDAVHRKVHADHPVNLALGHRIALNSVIDELARIADGPLSVVRGPARPGDVHDSQADCSRLMELFPAVQPIEFEQALRETFAWHASLTEGDSLLS